MGKDNNKNFIIGLIIAVLVLVGSWAVFALAQIGVDSLLIKLGITSEWLQLTIIIVAVIIILVAMGFGFKKAIKKIVE